MATVLNDEEGKEAEAAVEVLLLLPLLPLALAQQSIGTDALLRFITTTLHLSSLAQQRLSYFREYHYCYY